MLIVFLLIFVADTKLIYGYNFVAPLNAAVFYYFVSSGFLKLSLIFKGAKKYFMHYLAVVTILFSTSYISLHFLPILLKKLDFRPSKFDSSCFYTFGF